MQEGNRAQRQAASGAVGGGVCAVGSRSIPKPPTDATLTPAPDRSVAATLHRRGSSARGFTPGSSVSLSPPGLVAELVRPGPRWHAYPRVGLAGGLAAHARRHQVPVGGRYLCRSVGGSH